MTDGHTKVLTNQGALYGPRFPGYVRTNIFFPILSKFQCLYQVECVFIWSYILEASLQFRDMSLFIRSTFVTWFCYSLHVYRITHLQSVSVPSRPGTVVFLFTIFWPKSYRWNVLKHGVIHQSNEEINQRVSELTGERAKMFMYLTCHKR